MRRYPLSSSAALLALFACSAHAQTDTGLREQLRNPQGKPLVISHRACWMFAAENTLDGIDACVARGVDMVEVDVRTTADGELVLMHDETVDRTTDGHGAVANMKAAQFLALRNRPLGGGASLAPGLRHPPTLAEALEHVRGRVLINLDVKAADLDRVMDVVERVGAQRDVLMNVPLSMTKAQQDRAHAAGIAFDPVLFLRRSDASSPVEAQMQQALAMHPAAVQLLFDDIRVIERAARAVQGQARLFVNTMTLDIASKHPMNLSGRYTDAHALANADAIWGQLRAHGVSMLQTDEPMALQHYLHATPEKR
jgi:glycerophosphoryl diester phosphodiesterase